MGEQWESIFCDVLEGVKFGRHEAVTARSVHLRQNRGSDATSDRASKLSCEHSPQYERLRPSPCDLEISHLIRADVMLRRPLLTTID
jgi:hypothetical protein